MRRLFFAISLPEDVQESVGEIQRRVRRGISGMKWVDPERMHVTMKFLGNTPEALVDDVVARGGCLAETCAPMELSLAGLGAFPGLVKPRVLWVGLGGDVENLVALGEKLDRAMVDLHFEAERRPFSAHVTLARSKPRYRPDSVEGLISKHSGLLVASFRATHLDLYESHLSRTGPTYVRLATLPLAGHS